MKFKCPKCKKIIKRDGRLKSTKRSLDEDGNLKTFCEVAGEDVIAIKKKR